MWRVYLGIVLGALACLAAGFGAALDPRGGSPTMFPVLWYGGIGIIATCVVVLVVLKLRK